MPVHFTADHHFGHGGARGLFRRPFDSTPAMDEAMVRRWNETVAPGDEVWHLGDFALGPDAARRQALLESLNGVKYLVAGNNDDAATLGLAGWRRVEQLAELELEDRRLVLCHYPLRSWNGMNRGAIQLHGHCHGRMKPLPRQLDVGVDAHDFRPWTLDEVLAAVRRRARSSA